MKSLTPEQQAFAEEHHGLLLDFMAKHSLGDDYYDLLANRYLKVVVRYLSEEALRKYSFCWPLSSDKPQFNIKGAGTSADCFGGCYLDHCFNDEMKPIPTNLKITGGNKNESFA